MCQMASLPTEIVVHLFVSPLTPTRSIKTRRDLRSKCRSFGDIGAFKDFKFRFGLVSSQTGVKLVAIMLRSLEPETYRTAIIITSNSTT